jgi:hypothetical protein
LRGTAVRILCLPPLGSLTVVVMVRSAEGDQPYMPSSLHHPPSLSIRSLFNARTGTHTGIHPPKSHSTLVKLSCSIFILEVVEQWAREILGARDQGVSTGDGNAAWVLLLAWLLSSVHPCEIARLGNLKSRSSARDANDDTASAFKGYEEEAGAACPVDHEAVRLLLWLKRALGQWLARLAGKCNEPKSGPVTLESTSFRVTS